VFIYHSYFNGVIIARDDKDTCLWVLLFKSR